MKNRQWRLTRRPIGAFQPEDFVLSECPLEPLRDGEVRVALKYLSLDPTNRVWAREGDSYLPSIALGEVMRGIALGRVEESSHAAYSPGDLVTGFLGWEDYSVAAGEDLKIVDMDPRIPLAARFALFEHIGSPAYFGLTDIGKIKHGDNVVITAAAGAVGSLALQMARILGAGRVVGVAGSDEKCAWLKTELGADAAVNYRRGNLRATLNNVGTFVEGADRIG